MPKPTFYPKKVGDTLRKYYDKDKFEVPPQTIITWIGTDRPSGNVSLARKGDQERKIAYFNSYAQLLMILEIIVDFWGRGQLSY